MVATLTGKSLLINIVSNQTVAVVYAQTRAPLWQDTTSNFMQIQINI